MDRASRSIRFTTEKRSGYRKHRSRQCGYCEYMYMFQMLSHVYTLPDARIFICQDVPPFWSCSKVAGHSAYDLQDVLSRMGLTPNLTQTMKNARRFDANVTPDEQRAIRQELDAVRESVNSAEVAIGEYCDRLRRSIVYAQSGNTANA